MKQSETLQKTIEAIINRDKDNLLQRFFEEEGLKITNDGQISNENGDGEKFSPFQYIIKHKALNCGLVLIRKELLIFFAFFYKLTTTLSMLRKLNLPSENTRTKELQWGI